MHCYNIFWEELEVEESAYFKSWSASAAAICGLFGVKHWTMFYLTGMIFKCVISFLNAKQSFRLFQIKHIPFLVEDSSFTLICAEYFFHSTFFWFPLDS